MVKKIAGLLLFTALLTATPAMAATSTQTAAKAAPAVAVEILKQYGAEPTDAIISQVAAEMGPRSSFLGVKMDDPMYARKVKHYLHCTLKVIETEEHDCMHHGMME